MPPASPTSAPPLTYRPELDGLRAVSILCVLLYHFKLGPFTGGYVGVDVFFVISGYLITRIIFSEIDKGTFSLARFFARRIRRLFPALFVVVLVCFVIGLLWFPPDLFRNQARDTVTALASVANIFFWRSSNDYFGWDLVSSPLLHTWSLSVEDQFYLVWALALAGGAATRLWRYRTAIILVATLASLAAAERFLTIDRSASFFLTPFRFFELGLGALVIWLERYAPPRWLGDVCVTLGLTGIVAAALVFDAKTPFPGLTALLPCLGAAAVIYGGQNSAAAAVLRHRIAVGIGLISYSLYLCHWPILIFGTWLFGEHNDPAWKLALTAASFAAAFALYRLVEQPFRHPARPVGPARVFAGAAAVGSVLLVPALAATLQHGWDWRIGARQEVHRLQSFGYWPCTANGQTCPFGAAGAPPALLLIGDSFAQQLVAGLHKTLQARGQGGSAETYGGCLMLDGLNSARGGKPIAHCIAAKAKAMQIARAGDMPLVINQAWASYGPDTMADDQGQMIRIADEDARLAVIEAALERTVASLGPTRRFLIVGAQPYNGCSFRPFALLPSPLPRPAAMQSCAPTPVETVRTATERFDGMLRAFQRRHAGQVDIVLPVELLCASNCAVMDNAYWLYQDSSHFTVAGSEYLMNRAQATLKAALDAPQARP